MDPMTFVGKVFPAVFAVLCLVGAGAFIYYYLFPFIGGLKWFYDWLAGIGKREQS